MTPDPSSINSMTRSAVRMGNRTLLRGTQVTLATTLNQQQAVAELPIAGISGEIA